MGDLAAHHAGSDRADRPFALIGNQTGKKKAPSAIVLTGPEFPALRLNGARQFQQFAGQVS